MIGFLINIFKKNQDKDAIIWKDRTYSYQELLDQIIYWQEKLDTEKITSGMVTALEADFSPNAIALFLALIEKGCLLVPLTSSVVSKKEEFMEIAQAEVSFCIDKEDQVHIHRLPHCATHALYQQLRDNQHPGLILFSSGSTGKSKAVVHDFLPLLEKFKVSKKSFRAMTFLLYDHIGGVDTMLYILSNGGCVVTVDNRNPENILRLIAQYKVEILPTSPTFINLILLSEVYKNYDLTSLKKITYGTEPMLEDTLKRFHQLFPDIQLIQTYGLSELGVLRSRSQDSSSLWVKISGEGVQLRGIDGILQVKSPTAMLGYLNAESPFTKDGWLNTDDVVEQKGEYIRIMGRKSEIINVGGEKVFPAEVENVIQSIDNVAHVTVYKENNPITGNIVCAKVNLIKEEDKKILKNRITQYCMKKLEPYKIPVKISVVKEKQYSGRFKKRRLV